MAPHKKEINWDLVELYVKAGCCQTRIAESLFIDRDTLRARVKEKYGVEYSAFSAALQSEGKLLIEAKQYDKAMKGYWPALLWLGKVKLGQKEPVNEPTEAPNQMNIDKDQIIMRLQNTIAELESNGNKRETE